ncbi:MAG: ion channel [Microcella sp.]|uniref:ion channel n=1 Tax=Microcella sp. TaxID=1913979 RepID=UPI003314A9B1
MDALIIVSGLLLIAVGWLDVFHTLLNPSGRGFLTRGVFAAAWATTRRARRARVLAGPGSMVVVIALWSGLQVVGWALVYLPSIPEGFAYFIDAQGYNPFVEAVYFSTTTLTTLGFGDLVPTASWIRIVAPIQALAGFALLTAAASWFVQMHAALARRRSLALRLTQAREAGFGDVIAQPGSDASTAVILESIAASVATVRVDYLQTSESYYFSEADERASLSAGLHVAWQFALSSSHSADPGVRAAGAVLTAALHDLADCLRSSFLPGDESTPDILGRYSADHVFRHRDRSG